MSNNENATGQAQGVRGGLEEYLKLASDLVSGPLGSRSGLGALREFRNILDQTIRLALESNLTKGEFSSNWGPWALDPDAFHFFSHHFRGGPATQLDTFFGRWLASPACYNPQAIWALFWGLVKAEHSFLRDYVPFWSNEERLTGHLVSEMVHCLREFSPHWDALSKSSAADSACRISYADTATSRRESVTGADLGLIIHGKLFGKEEFIKVARFQAKKVEDRKANLRLDQTENLLRFDNLGYYLFYHRAEKKLWTLPSTVLPAKWFEEHVKKCVEKQGKVSKSDIVSVEADRGFDFASFVTFAIADITSSYGFVASNAREAVKILMASNSETPSRVLVVTLGPSSLGPGGAGEGQSGPNQWEELFSHFEH